jgi:murein DD-endopeptidase MepM/ murein hydrolase activator NlpD
MESTKLREKAKIKASKSQNFMLRLHRFLQDRLSFRLRIKPNWKGRVYGTYHIHVYYFFFFAAALALISWQVSHFIMLDLAEPNYGRELENISFVLDYEKNFTSVESTKKIDELTKKAKAFDELSKKHLRILGLRQEDEQPQAVGIGSNGAYKTPLEKLSADVGYLFLNRLNVLQKHMEERSLQIRYTPSILPILGECTGTSSFGSRYSPFTKRPETHQAQDLACPLRTRIIAPADGTVEKVSNNPYGSRYGRYIVVNHNGLFKTLYAHCYRVLVSENENVVRGQVIGEVGTSGRSTGSHLHYEVIKDRDRQDPRYYILDADLSKLEEILLD